MNNIFFKYYYIVLATIFISIGWSKVTHHSFFNDVNHFIEDGVHFSNSKKIEQHHKVVYFSEVENEAEQSEFTFCDKLILKAVSVWKFFVSNLSTTVALKNYVTPLFTSFYSSLDALYIAFRVFRL